jgi:hypothetical protein
MLAQSVSRFQVPTFTLRLRAKKKKYFGLGQWFRQSVGCRVQNFSHSILCTYFWTPLGLPPQWRVRDAQPLPRNLLAVGMNTLPCLDKPLLLLEMVTYPAPNAPNLSVGASRRCRCSAWLQEWCSSWKYSHNDRMCWRLHSVTQWQGLAFKFWHDSFSLTNCHMSHWVISALSFLSLVSTTVNISNRCKSSTASVTTTNLLVRKTKDEAL